MYQRSPGSNLQETVPQYPLNCNDRGYSITIDSFNQKSSPSCGLLHSIVFIF